MANPEITKGGEELFEELKALLIPSEEGPAFDQICDIFKAFYESRDLPSLAKALEACTVEDSDTNIFWDIDYENDATGPVMTMLWPEYGEAIMAQVKEDENYSDAEVSDCESFLDATREMGYDNYAYKLAAGAVKASIEADAEAAAPSGTDDTTDSKPDPGACALADTNPENPENPAG